MKKLKLKIRKGYAGGGPVSPEQLANMTPQQLQQYDALLSDEDKLKYLKQIYGGDEQSNGIAKGNPSALPYAAAGEIGSSIISNVNVKPENKNALIFREGTEDALKWGAKGAAIGANPALLAATQGLSLPIGAAAGFIGGAIKGGLDGKKEYNSNMDAKRLSDQKNVANAEKGIGVNVYSEGGPIKAAGAKSKTGKKLGEYETASRYADERKYARGTSHILIYGDLYDDPAPKPAKTPAKKAVQAKAAGGEVQGPGTAKSDSIYANVPAGSFIIPAENAKIAEQLRARYLTKEKGKANLSSGNTPVKLSNGEHMFSPKEWAILESKGVDLDALAPNQHTGTGKKEGGEVEGDGGDDPKRLSYKTKPKAEPEKLNVDLIALYGDPDEVKKKFQDLQNQYNSEKDAEKKKAIWAQIQELQPSYDYWYTHSKEADAARAAKTQKLFSENFEAKEPGAPEEQKKETTAPAPKAGSGTSGSNTGKSSGTTSSGVYDASKDTELQRLKKEYPSIYGDTSEKIETEKKTTATGTKAVDTTAQHIADLRKKYDELALAGKAESDEAKAIRDELHSFGASTSEKGINPYAQPNPESVASKNAAYTDPVTGKTEVYSENPETGAVETPTGTQKPMASKILDALGGPAGLAALAQTGIGLAQTQKNKRPIDKVSSEFQTQYNDAVNRSKYGFTEGEKSAAKDQIEMNRRGMVYGIQNYAAGNAGTAAANSRMAARDANAAYVGLAAEDARLKESKAENADQMAARMQEAKRRIFEDDLNAYDQNQQAGAALISAGLGNFFGNQVYRDTQNRMDERDKKYGGISFTLPTAP